MQRSSAVLGCSLAILLCAFGCAHKQGGAGADRPSYSITKKAGEYLRDTREQANKKHWEAALHTLDRMAESNLNPYERAMMFLARSGVHFATEANEEAAKDLEQAVALDAMPLAEQQAAEFNLGQLLFMMDRFDDSANAFAKWAKHVEGTDTDPQQEYVAASAFGQAHRFEEALPHAQKAVDGMKEAKEPWLQLVISLQFELHHEAEVAAALERMVKAFPRKDYWLQLTQTYEDMGENDKAAKAIKSAYAAGMITEEKDLLNMARLLLQGGKAKDAAAVLDKHLRDGKLSKNEEVLELLAECAVASKDVARAEAAMKTVGDNGSALLYFQLGLLYAEKGSWEKARDAAASSLAKGGPGGETRLLLGMAHYNTKRKDAALTAFSEAKKSPSTAACADLWVKQVKSGKSGQPSGCTTADLAAAVAAPEKTSTASAD